MSDSCDVLIVGAGASGAASAWNLSKHFEKVVCLEQGTWTEPSSYPSTKEDWEFHRTRDYSPFPNERNLPSDYPINDQESQISIDPGLGFGKTMRDSEILFKNLDVFCFGFPLVVGYSKKKFTENLNMTNNQLYQHCIDSGAALVRLHIAS